MVYLCFFITIVILYIILKLISLPIRLIIKLIVNAFLGGLILFIINLIGAQFGFILTITWFTSIIIGFLGVPGVILVIILHFFM